MVENCWKLLNRQKSKKIVFLKIRNSERQKIHVVVYVGI